MIVAPKIGVGYLDIMRVKKISLPIIQIISNIKERNE
jgi:hypothetical protein